MVKKYLRENTFTIGVNHLLKLVAFVLWRRIRADDQMTKTEERVCALFLLSPQRSRRLAGRELDDVSHTTMWRVLRKRLTFCPYKFKLLQVLKPNYRSHLETFVQACWRKLLSLMRIPFTYQGRWIAVICSSGHHRIPTKLSNMCETLRRWTFLSFK
jgi:hypothetical protein